MIIGFFPFEAHYDAFPPSKNSEKLFSPDMQLLQRLLVRQGQHECLEAQGSSTTLGTSTAILDCFQFYIQLLWGKKNKTLDAAFPGIIPGSILNVLCNLDKAISCVSDTVLQ